MELPDTELYTPQQNGVAERMNRTIMERVRCMLSEANLPYIFWIEAVSLVPNFVRTQGKKGLRRKVRRGREMGECVKVVGWLAFGVGKTTKCQLCVDGNLL